MSLDDCIPAGASLTLRAIFVLTTPWHGFTYCVWSRTVPLFGAGAAGCGESAGAELTRGDLWWRREKA